MLIKTVFIFTVNIITIGIRFIVLPIINYHNDHGAYRCINLIIIIAHKNILITVTVFYKVVKIGLKKKTLRDKIILQLYNILKNPTSSWPLFGIAVEYFFTTII